jgi:hypothetical protein
VHLLDADKVGATMPRSDRGILPVDAVRGGAGALATADRRLALAERLDDPVVADGGADVQDAAIVASQGRESAASTGFELLPDHGIC